MYKDAIYMRGWPLHVLDDYLAALVAVLGGDLAAVESSLVLLVLDIRSVSIAAPLAGEMTESQTFLWTEVWSESFRRAKLNSW